MTSGQSQVSLRSLCAYFVRLTLSDRRSLKYFVLLEMERKTINIHRIYTKYIWKNGLIHTHTLTRLFRYLEFVRNWDKGIFLSIASRIWSFSSCYNWLYTWRREKCVHGQYFTHCYWGHQLHFVKILSADDKSVISTFITQCIVSISV